MTSDDVPEEKSEGQVVHFRPRMRPSPASGPPAPPAGETPSLDLRKYEHGGEQDDYRHRMIVNVVGLGIAALLIAGGVWLASTMAEMRKNQDCVLSGRRNCSPVAAPIQLR